MWHLLRKSYSIQVSRVRVMQVLWEEAPEATTQRRAHKLVWRDFFSFESNFCWHCDNYDKLKPYRLPIYVSINGFSRTVIWLEVCRTNSNPRVVAAMYIRAVQSLGLVPKMLRTDHGNKTGIMTAVHCTLRQNADTYRYGTSVANQRIENFWSHFRCTFTSWLAFLNKWLTKGYWNWETIFICIWFCFSDLLQLKPNNFAERWNTHHIRSPKSNYVASAPDQLFPSPEEHGYIKCETPLLLAELDYLKQQIDIEER